MDMVPGWVFKEEVEKRRKNIAGEEVSSVAWGGPPPSADSRAC